jgi:hypothetical protein
MEVQLILLVSREKKLANLSMWIFINIEEPPSLSYTLIITAYFGFIFSEKNLMMKLKIERKKENKRKEKKPIFSQI